MATVTRATTIACPPEAVFAVLRDVRRLPEFSEMTVGVSGAPARPLEVGDGFAQVVRVLGIELDTSWEVTRIEESRLLTFSGHGPAGAKASLVERITPAADATHVELEVDYDLPLGVLGDIADALVVERAAESEAEQILDRLKSLCEATAPSTTPPPAR